MFAYCHSPPADGPNLTGRMAAPCDRSPSPARGRIPTGVVRIVALHLIRQSCATRLTHVSALRGLVAGAAAASLGGGRPIWSESIPFLCPMPRTRLSTTFR